MALIKNSQSNRLIKEAIVLDMGDLGLHAQRILQAARDEAAQVVEDAKANAQRLVDQASGKGHAEGFAKGIEEGRDAGRQEGREQAINEFRDQFQSLTKAWSTALSQWECQREALLHDAREDVITFAIQVADKVVRRVIQQDFTIVKDQLGEALKLLGKSTAVDVVVNPADRQLIDEVLPELVSGIQTCQNISIRMDDSMLRGGCIVTTRGGRVDASIETQLDRIAVAFCGEAVDAQATDQP